MASVSVICVFNDEEVRRGCLDRSLHDGGHEEAGVEYLPIDNTGGAFSSAGAALNHGARAAHNDYLVFVHQDVYLHSLGSLKAVAEMMAGDPGLGMSGAVGIDARGRILGRIRDRVVLIGEPCTTPASVDSLDEVLFVVAREQVLAEPLSEDPELAWHAYAVEYGARLRSLGRRVVAADIPITHNSLTINLERLEVAHAAVAERHPAVLPLQTTCGTVRAPGQGGSGRPLLRRHRWRGRWLAESWRAASLHRLVPGARVVLSDVRRDVDDVLVALGGSPLLVVNLVEREHFGGADATTAMELALLRRSYGVSFTSCPVSDAGPLVAGTPKDLPVLVTNVSAQALLSLARELEDRDVVLGLHGSIGAWLLLGPAARVDLAAWRSPRATPLLPRQRTQPPGGGGEAGTDVLREQVTEAGTQASSDQDR